MDKKNLYIPDEIKDNLDPEVRVEYYWTIDSETGDKYLMDLKTGKQIGRWIYNGPK